VRGTGAEHPNSPHAGYSEETLHQPALRGSALRAASRYASRPQIVIQRQFRGQSPIGYYVKGKGLTPKAIKRLRNFRSNVAK
jgi:hypothetical protein